jgi:hypothetical protein
MGGDLCDELDGLPTLRRGQQFPLVGVKECLTDCRTSKLRFFTRASNFKLGAKAGS